MHTIAASAPPRRILRLARVLERIPVDPSTLWRWERAGLFPLRVAIGPNMIGWYSDEIDAWIEARQRSEATGRPSPNPLTHRTAATERERR
jgi:prophage regulatory protein